MCIACIGADAIRYTGQSIRKRQKVLFWYYGIKNHPRYCRTRGGKPLIMCNPVSHEGDNYAKAHHCVLVTGAGLEPATTRLWAW